MKVAFHLLLCFVAFFLGEIRARKRIVDGEPAEAGRYPYMASHAFGDFIGCGATLIAPNVVLSAAHCGGSANSIAIGCLTSNPSQEGGDCEVIEVEEYIEFQGFGVGVGGSLFNDFSIFVLKGNATNPPIAFLPSGDLDFPSGQDFTTMGFGRIFVGGPASDVLLETDVDYVPNPDCNQKYTLAAGGDPIDASQICGARPGKDACQGDSGGPMIVRCDLTGEDMVVGVTSWGYGCASTQYPGVWSRASFAIDFISDIVEAQGHSLNLISSMDEFCLVGGTQAPTSPTLPPTSFPTFPTSWTCDVQNYALFDGCHCGCGAPDPDCEVSQPEQPVIGCESGLLCIDGVCSTPAPTAPIPPTPPTAFPTTSPTRFIPPEWTCNEDFYNSADGCDCECGAPDPDCDIDPPQTLFGCDDVPEATCVEGQCVSGVTFVPSLSPIVSVTSLPSSSPVASPVASPTPIATDAPAGSGTDSPSDADDILASYGLLLVIILAGLVIVLAVVALCLVVKYQKQSTSTQDLEVKAQPYYEKSV